MPSNKHNIKAIFSDLDGTLLGPDHKIGPAALHALERIRKEYNNEIPFIVATGRPYADVFATLTDCNLEPDYIITSNGARIHDKQRQLVAKSDLDVDFLREALAVVAGVAGQGPAYLDNLDERHKAHEASYGVDFNKERQFTINMFCEDAWVVDIGLPTYEKVFHDSFRFTAKGVDGLQQLTDTELESTHELFFIGPPENLAGLMEHLQAQFKGRAHFTFPLPFILDCVSAEINKGKALSQVTALLNIDPEDVVAFGDGMNDESMLRLAGHPFIMRNGSNLLKEALPDVEVIRTNVEAGVVRKLEELLL